MITTNEIKKAQPNGRISIRDAVLIGTVIFAAGSAWARVEIFQSSIQSLCAEQSRTTELKLTYLRNEMQVKLDTLVEKQQNLVDDQRELRRLVVKGQATDDKRYNER